jgi:hypothetical protein
MGCSPLAEVLWGVAAWFVRQDNKGVGKGAGAGFAAAAAAAAAAVVSAGKPHCRGLETIYAEPRHAPQRAACRSPGVT